MNDWKNWVKGLIAAVINGAAGAIALMLAAPEKFNFSDFPTLGKTALVFALLGLANYLKQSPLP